ncbi:hypothetical protein GDO81_021050 [Engystomops pustulosus]|uniref:Ig-like domain-containing protein n=1 Tax=Engystomops pustulosus TaxID=76066 RepID=A0AAV6ZJE9_ENGPU|nr:hypothetical protein GDO81_021050 [Engystomops pustulosus]KAG8549484.1 hypothetical protein GDO81_021050 [Engystomops pustulosus]KAG8549486.1 hypothetical protein GDO81_021050 [Engystomops pustulosus]
MRGRSVLPIFILFQVCVGQEKKFHFPDKIQAVLGSCVEIPCYTTAPPTEGRSNKVVWHVQPAMSRSRIIYSTDVSEISTVFRGRADLVKRTTENCTLRIHDVRRQDLKSYFPRESKISILRPASVYVNLEVKDSPPVPVLSMPAEMRVGETITITCMANFTCASSPPTFTWNLIGPSVTERSDLGNGIWQTASNLTYKPTENENGSVVRCTVTHFGGPTISATAMINIKINIKADEDQKANPYIGPVIGILCVILLLAIGFIIWRKRDSCLWQKKTEAISKLHLEKNALSKNSSGYTDLLERQTSSYYTIEPTARCHVPRQGRNMMKPPENEPIYEEMSIKRTK